MVDQPVFPLVPVVPFGAQRGRYLPVAGGSLTITLPGEKVRAAVSRVVSRDSLVCRLSGPILGTGRLHTYRAGEMVAVERVVDELGQEIWRIISERELRMREDAERLAREEAERRNLPILAETAEKAPQSPAPGNAGKTKPKKQSRRMKKSVS